jgi:hypothetical protein
MGALKIAAGESADHHRPPEGVAGGSAPIFLSERRYSSSF